MKQLGMFIAALDPADRERIDAFNQNIEWLKQQNNIESANTKLKTISHGTKHSNKNVVPDLDKIIHLGYEKLGYQSLQSLSGKLGVGPDCLGTWKRKRDRNESRKAQFSKVLTIANTLHVGVDELIKKVN